MRTALVLGGAAAALGLLLAPGLAGAQMMGGGAAVAGNGVGQMEWDSEEHAAPRYDAAAEYRGGVANMQLGKYRDAQKNFDHALIVEPKDADTLCMMGETLAALGDYKGAIRNFERSLKVDPNQIPARREYAVALAKYGQPAQAQQQLTILKTRADACAGACADAADLQSAMAKVQAAIATAPAAAG